MFSLIGFLDDPSDKNFSLFSRFGQQFEGDHVQHLDGLVDFCVKFAEVVEPKEEEADN